MFAQYTYIDEQHKLAMTSVIRQQPFVTEAFLARLYRAAQGAAEGDVPTGIAANMIKQGSTSLCTATDIVSGVFIQLADSGKGKMLTVGKKWVIQGHDPISNTTQIKLL